MTVTERILVAYATRYGSTREVAERIGEVLGRRGAPVEVTSAESVGDLGGYSAVVLGSPYYIGKMLKPAREFLAKHRDALAALPVAVFALGPVGPTDDEAEARQQLDDTLASLG